MTYVCSLTNNKKVSSEGAIILNSIEELYQIIACKETREIVIKDEFIDKYFTPSAFTSFVKECKRINKFLEIIYNPKYTFYFNDMVKSLSKIDDIDSLINYILLNKDGALSMIRNLCNQYEQNHRQVLSENSRLSNMLLELLEEKRLREQEKEEHKITASKLVKATAELDAMVSSINHRYGRAIDTEKYSGITISGNNYSKILYVKEISRVRHVDTLLYYLQEIIKSVYLKQARFMVIESPYSDGRIALYPRCKAYNAINNINVANQDIFMAGYQVNIAESVLENPFNADYLIVLDRSGYEDLYITGNDVEVLYTVSDIEDVSFNILHNRLISYSPQTLQIPLIENFSELTWSDRINEYYSMDIIKAILQLLEG